MKLREMSDKQLRMVLKEARKRLNKKQRMLESHRKEWNEAQKKKKTQKSLKREER